MEIVGKMISEAQAKRRLLMVAYLLVAVPVSGLLWQLLSPARQIERQAWLPMRDALAPLPVSRSSLTPPIEDEAEALTAAPQARSSSGERGATLGRFADRVKEMHAGRQAPAGPAPAAASRGHLGAFSSFLNGSSGAGQSGAGLTLSRLPTPTSASAGSLGSAGLVTSGASKRFAPARLQRAGGANGFMGSGRPGAVRLMNGTSIEPEFRAAASAGIPGYSAAGQPQSGGAASVGGQVGMGEGNRLDDKNDSSFNNSTLPLTPPPAVPPAVSAVPWTSSRASTLKAAACEAFTQAASDSSALLERLRTDAKTATDMLRNTAVHARSAAITWRGQEEGLRESTLGLAGISTCHDAHGTDHCAALKSCLQKSLDNLKLIRGNFSQEIGGLGSATTQLWGAPPAGEGGFNLATRAINLEESTLRPSIPGHLEIVGICEELARLIPRTVCVQIDERDRCTKNGDFTAGNFVRQRALALAKSGRNVQNPIKTDLNKSWCERPGSPCNPLDEAALLGELTKHSDALQVFAEEAPKEPLDKTADAAEHLAKAAQLLNSPAGDGSRNLAQGALELKKAADALDDSNRQWTAQRDEACGTVKPPAPSLRSTGGGASTGTPRLVAM